MMKYWVFLSRAVNRLCVTCASWKRGLSLSVKQSQNFQSPELSYDELDRTEWSLIQMPPFPQGALSVSGHQHESKAIYLTNEQTLLK